MKQIYILLLSLLGLGLHAQCEYSETFESYANSALPTGWSVINTTGVTFVSANVQSNTSAPSPTKYFRISNSTATTGNFMVALPMNANTSDGNHRISFYLNGSNNSASKLQVGTIDTPDATGTFSMITEISGFPTGTAWKKYYVDIPAGTNQYVVFRHNLGGATNVFSLDNICFQQIPTCLEISGINTTNIAPNSVTFGWTASNSNETKWEYIVQSTTATAPTATTFGTEATQNSATANNLTSDTSYNVFVRSKCSDTDFGSWEGPLLVTTSCSAYTANYASGFEDNVNTEEVKPCWSVSDTGTGDLKTYGTTFGVTPAEGAMQLRLYFLSSTANNSLALISPQFSDLSNEKQIRFKMNKRSGFEANMKIEIGTVASPTDMSTFTLLDDTTLNQTSVVASTWTEFTIPLTNYNNALGHQYIVFRPQHGGTGATQYIFMDDFHYEWNLNVALNDEPITADPITVSPDYHCANAVTGTFEGATRSPEFPCNTPLYTNYKDLWYKLIPTEGGRHSFSLTLTNGSTNGNMFVWHQEANGSLTQISLGCLTRFTAQDLVAGETYFISIASTIPTLGFTLCVKKFPQSTNDEPAVAQQLLESTYKVCENAIEGNTALATHSSDSACTSSTTDVWYTFTPTRTAEYTFKRTYLNGSAPTGITVYSGTPGNLTMLTATCGGQIVLVNLTAGQTYYVAVSTSPLSEPVYFSLCAYPSPPAPANDSCATPTNLIVGSSFDANVIVADNTSATVDPSNSPYPSCGTADFSTRGRDIWFTVTVPPSGNFVVETRLESGSLINDTVMETYTGSCGSGTLTPFYYNLPAPNVGTAYCNDQFVIGGNQYAGIRFTGKTPGQQVFVRVWGWSSQFGEFKISAYDDSPVMGTDSTEKNKMSVYPNPVTDVLNIQNDKVVKEVLVYDLTGKIISKSTLNSQKGVLNLAHLKTGMYLIKLITDDSTETVKIIKK